MDLYVIFFIVSALLLVIEVMLGMTLGIALSGAITFLLLGVIEWFGLIHGLNIGSFNLGTTFCKFCSRR